MKRRFVAMVVGAMVLAGALWFGGLWPDTMLTHRHDTDEGHPGADATQAQGIDTIAAAAAAAAQPAAVNSTAAADASRKESSAKQSATATIRPQLSPKAAREAARLHQREQDCRSAYLISRPKSIAAREARDWRWLPAQQAEAERLAFSETMTRIKAGCDPPPIDAQEASRRSEAARAALKAASEAGDLYARLSNYQRRADGSYDVDTARALMYEAVLTRDLEAIARLWTAEGTILLEAYSRTGQQSTSANDMVLLDELWPLIACDLGMDCGRGSPALNRQCLNAWSGCTSDSVEAAIRERTPPWQWTLMQQRREQLVNRIRSGQIAGMFDAVPQRARSGGG